MLSVLSSWLSWPSRNSSRVSTSASGNGRSACSRRAVFSAVGPPLTFRSVKSLSCVANELSNVVFEIATSLNGEPPFGSSKIPSTWSRRVFHVGRPRRRRGGLARERVVAGRDGVVGDEELGDRARERRAEGFANHRDEGDQCEPDHHRGRRGGRPGRVSHGVLAGQRSG